MNKFRTKTKRKIKPVTLVLDGLLAIFFIFIVVLMVKHNKEQETESEQLYGAFHYEEMDTGIVLTEYLGSEAEPEIPREIDGKKVTSIAQGCFKDNIYMEKITIPSNIWGIGIGAFKGCIRLKEVKIQNGVEMIASYAFQNCKGLEYVVIPASVETIGLEAFSYAADFTIVGEEGSEAERFASDNNIKFEALNK